MIDLLYVALAVMVYVAIGAIAYGITERAVRLGIDIEGAGPAIAMFWPMSLFVAVLAGVICLALLIVNPLYCLVAGEPQFWQRGRPKPSEPELPPARWPDEITTIGEYRRLKRLVQQYEEHLPVLERES